MKSPVSAPVWDRAKSDTSERPTFSATTGLVAATRDTASHSARPSATPSTCSATARVAGSAAR